MLDVFLASDDPRTSWFLQELDVTYVTHADIYYTHTHRWKHEERGELDVTYADVCCRMLYTHTGDSDT
jgi:hypothetical protein